jgi:hypothetical protein
MAFKSNKFQVNNLNNSAMVAQEYNNEYISISQAIILDCTSTGDIYPSLNFFGGLEPTTPSIIRQSL